MICPACGRPLTEKQLGSLHMEACQGGCGGIWFDTLELHEVRRETDAAGESLLSTERNRRIQVDPSQPRTCPRCTDVLLKRLLFGAGSQANVDECPKCGGCWLDDDEMAQLRFEQSQLKDSQQAYESDESSDLIKYLYEVRTGRRQR
jgi:Zn-finger nucleic acid-binding protein